MLGSPGSSIVSSRRSSVFDDIMSLQSQTAHNTFEKKNERLRIVVVGDAIERPRTYRVGKRHRDRRFRSFSCYIEECIG